MAAQRFGQRRRGGVGAPLAGAGGISGGQWLATRARNDEVEGRWRVAARAATRGGGRPEGWVEGAAGQSEVEKKMNSGPLLGYP